MNSYLKRILLLVLTVLMTSILCFTMYVYDNKYSKKGLNAIDGLLVVEKDAMQSCPISYLVTGWAFYPNALLSPENFSNGSPDNYCIYTSVGDKVHFDNAGTSEDPHGSGSYFLRLQLPKETATYALELPEIYSAYKLYVGDRMVLQMGNPESANHSPRTQNRMITFEASGSTSILIAVSDYSHFYSGMVYPPAFGTPLALNTTRALRMGIALFADTLALLAAALTLYFGLRMKHQNAKLFSMLCIVMCFFTSYTLLHSLFELPIFPWYALEMTSGYLLSLLLVILYNRISNVGPCLKLISVSAASIICILALFYGLYSAFLTIPLMRAFSALIFWFKLALSIYLLTTAFFSLRRSNRKAEPLFYASVIYATTFFWDRIFPSFEPILSGWFIEWGSLALVCAIGYTLWRDIITTYANGLIFAQEHRLMIRQLAVQTEYTRQLQKSNDENRRLTHDFRHHIYIIKSIAAQFGEGNEILRYLSKYSSTVTGPIYFHKYCSNAAVNALLQYYKAVTEENQIQTDFQFLMPEVQSLTDIEWCTILGNLLENAVESCLRQPEGERIIRISTSFSGKTYFFVMENSSNGIYKLENGRFLSRKPGPLRFGIGLESVRHTITQHGGSLDIFPEATKFRVGITLHMQ